jgi:hypothetical protein
MEIINSAADIKIYNYRDRTVHSEKGLVLFKKEKDNFIIACLGEECEKYRMDLSDSDNYVLAIPFSLGAIADYPVAEKLLKYLLNKYVHTSGGKRRLFKRADRVLLFLHEPCGPVDLKAYEDLMMLLGYKDVHMITTKTDLGGLSVEEAIWNMEEAQGKKFDCAIEITKNNPYEYAKYSYEKLLEDFKRWGVEPAEVIK